MHPKKFSPPKNYIETYTNFIHLDDAPILALASFINANYLITLNTKHFIENSRLKSLDLQFKIFTPGKFILHMGEKILKA